MGNEYDINRHAGGTRRQERKTIEVWSVNNEGWV